MTLVVPQIHANGTPPGDLVDRLENVWLTLQEAYKQLRLCAPNSRDYAGMDNYQAAVKQHNERFRAIQTLQADLEREIGEINKQTGASWL